MMLVPLNSFCVFTISSLIWLGCDRIEAGCRFIVKQDRGPIDDEPGESRPFPHSARKVRGHFFFYALEPHHGKGFFDFFLDRLWRKRFPCRGISVLIEVKGRVFFDIHRIEEGGSLKEHPHVFDGAVDLVFFQACDIEPVDFDRTLVGLFDADDMAEQDALAHSGASQDDQNLAVQYIEVEPAQNLIRSVSFPEVLRDLEIIASSYI